MHTSGEQGISHLALSGDCGFSICIEIRRTILDGPFKGFKQQVLQVQEMHAMRKASKAASVEVEPSAAITITTPYCMTSQSPKAPLLQDRRTALKADSVKVKPSTGALAPSPAMSQYSKASYSR